MFLKNLEILKKHLNPKWKLSLDPQNKILTLKALSTYEVIEIMIDTFQFLYSVLPSDKINITVKSTTELELTCLPSEKKHAKMYTSGCFDVFHYGHLNILEKSKELCDYLIVGVSTDELILKEKGRVPTIPFEERIRIVKAIKSVDEVIPQTDKNKQKIVDTYDIDAISVGDDWKGRFPETSCIVEYLPYTKSVSSTILKDTLQLNK
jgi:glycerol-3-phosphate cytidylyltransferase